MALIEGTDGSATIGGTAISKLTSVEINVTQATTDQGPFIGDANIATVRTGLSATFTGEGFLITPEDAGQALVVTDIMAGTDASMVITVGGGGGVQVFTCATCILTNVRLGLDTGSGAPFSFEGRTNGAFTLT